MSHEDSLKSDDNHEKDPDADTTTVSLTEFRAYTEQIEQICRDWLSRELSDESFLSRFATERLTRHIIREISSPDDDFDWSTIPADVMAACDNAQDYRRNAWKLAHAVKKTIEELQPEGPNGKDPIIRIAILGEHLREVNFSRKLLSQSQSRSPPNEPHGPPVPTP